jgi:hypothetical protein
LGADIPPGRAGLLPPLPNVFRDGRVTAAVEFFITFAFHHAVPAADDATPPGASIAPGPPSNVRRRAIKTQTKGQTKSPRPNATHLRIQAR